MKKGIKPKEVVGFHFGPIPLEEAKTMVLAGDGNYSDLKAKLLSAIPNLAEDEAFSFGLPKGEVPEDQRRGICHALNITLKQAGLPWRATYTSIKKLFLVVPKEQKKISTGVVSRSKFNNKIDDDVLRLRKQNMGNKEIAAELNVPLGAVNYVVYQKQHKRPAPPISESEKSANGRVGELKDASQLIHVAAKLWKVSEDEILSKKPPTHVKPIRKAIQFVAVDHLKANTRTVGAAFDITGDAIYYNVHNMNEKDKTAANELRSAI